MHTTKKSQSKLIKTVMSLAIIAGAAGAATGTYAWYSYQKDVDFAFSGTTIKADKEIQLGLYWKGELTRPESPTDPTLHKFTDDYTLGQIEEETGVKMTDDGEADYTIYWIKGNYITDILANFQYYIGSAQTELHPITAGKYKKGDKNDGATVGSWTNFMQTPTHRTGEWVTKGAVEDGNYSDYFYIPLAFRVLENEPDDFGNPVYSNGENIYLSKFDVVDVQHKEAEDADTSGMTPTQIAENEKIKSADLAKAVRVKADYPSHDDKGDNFIFDPHAETKYDLDVGGALNLQPDIYYDYVESTKEQILYGQFEEYYYKETTEEPTLSFDECSTFTANSLKGGKEIDKDTSKPSVCETEKTYVNPQHKDDAANGFYNIAKTDGYNNVGFLDLSIYLEGWDENIINLTTDRTFNVEIEFSIK